MNKQYHIIFCESEDSVDIIDVYTDELQAMKAVEILETEHEALRRQLKEETPDLRYYLETREEDPLLDELPIPYTPWGDVSHKAPDKAQFYDIVTALFGFETVKEYLQYRKDYI
jgi:hypothetical protein